jgi:hypothetical protein
MKQWKNRKWMCGPIFEEIGFLLPTLVSFKEILEISIQEWNEGKIFDKIFPRVRIND